MFRFYFLVGTRQMTSHNMSSLHMYMDVQVLSYPSKSAPRYIKIIKRCDVHEQILTSKLVLADLIRITINLV